MPSLRISTVANKSKEKVENVKPTRDLNVKNNLSTDVVINTPFKEYMISYSSRNPETGKEDFDYANFFGL